MKKIIYLLLMAFLISEGLAQHKTLILYYPNDSTNVISISNLDSMAVFICGASKVNYGGKYYNTVLISNQCWLKENLDIGTMINGNQTPNPTPGGTIEKYCYNDNPTNCRTYGGLYQWNEAMQYVTNESARGICPEGWHIPSQADIETLISTAGGNGNLLKAVSQGYGNGSGTDFFGFSALLAGNREQNGSFLHQTMRGHFWSSTSSGGNTYRIMLWDDRSDITPHPAPFGTYGFSVRCIKD